MDLVTWLDARGGVAHRSEVRAAGFGRRAEQATRTLGRWWVASPAALPLLAAAATRNGRVACVSAAKHRGLAVLHDPGLRHLVVAPNAHRAVGPRECLHWGRPLVPSPRGALVESVPDMLAHVATCLPRLDALVIWESALRKHLLTAASLRSIDWPSARARELATAASALSDSVLETVLADGLRRRGIPFVQQVPLGGHRVDFLVDGAVVVQTDGWEFHSDPSARRRDLEHDARLLLDGVPVLRFDKVHVLERLGATLDTIDEARWVRRRAA
ncbi:MAG: DUF559 domain-containing protein [Microbacteriaceae bacterium]|nr:DUF559 domain-containing protein [Microbacteriaceae bacterium]